jgi:hypothetical protein
MALECFGRLYGPLVSQIAENGRGYLFLHSTPLGYKLVHGKLILCTTKSAALQKWRGRA